MSTCTATANPREGVTLRCDRQAGHECIFDNAGEGFYHYDFHQDTMWLDDLGLSVRVRYRTVTR